MLGMELTHNSFDWAQRAVRLLVINATERALLCRVQAAEAAVVAALWAL